MKTGDTATRRRGESARLVGVGVLMLAAALGVAAQTKRPAARAAGAARAVGAASQFDRLARQANAARDADKLDEATALYLQALKLKPKWTEGWWYLGSIYYERDQYAKARDAFQNLAAIDPKFGTAWSMLGLCEFQLKEYESALQHLRYGNSFGFADNQELRRVARYHEAILFNRFENFEMAFDVLRRFINMQSESQDVIATIGLAMLRYPYLPSDVPPDRREVVFKAGRAAYLSITNRQADAQREYRELATAFGETPGVHYAYGVFLMRDNPDAALAELRRELQLSPNHVAARLQIAFEYIKRNEHKTGLPFAEEAARLAPDLFATHNALGRILLEVGDLDRAIRELETAARQAPDSPEMYFSLARAYAKAGRSEDAARARAEFARLEKLRRSQRGEGAAGDGKP